MTLHLSGVVVGKNRHITLIGMFAALAVIYGHTDEAVMPAGEEDGPIMAAA